jgi:hypothetical protein
VILPVLLGNLQQTNLGNVLSELKLLVCVLALCLVWFRVQIYVVVIEVCCFCKCLHLNASKIILCSEV